MLEFQVIEVGLDLAYLTVDLLKDAKDNLILTSDVELLKDLNRAKTLDVPLLETLQTEVMMLYGVNSVSYEFQLVIHWNQLDTIDQSQVDSIHRVLGEAEQFGQVLIQPEEIHLITNSDGNEVVIYEARREH